VNHHPYWWDTVDLARNLHSANSPQHRVQLPVRADVVVVGAGYTGLSAARRLALQGASVLVLDRHDIGWGASSRNGGQVLTGLRLDAATLVARYGEAKARRLFDAGNNAIDHLEMLLAEEKIECDYERCGHLQAASTPSHLKAFRGEQALLARVFNHRVTIVERGEQLTEIGSRLYHGLLVDERSAGLNPARYVQGLAAAAIRSGALVAGGVSVIRMIRQDPGWRVHTSSGEVAAGDVLVATNGYTDQVAPALQRRLVPVGSYIVVTNPLTTEQAAAVLPKRRMAFDSKHILYYFRLTADQRLLFGGRAEFTRPTAASTRRAAATLRRGMGMVFPDMADVRIEYAWGGNVAFARDEMPHGGTLDGMYFAGGYGGHGIALATELGDLIARRVGGQTVTNPLLDLECPTIPLYWGTPWFLPLAGAYYKVKDWMEAWKS
jgi:glycine/D-amino acid oxidase-like deaminating enzyme